MSQTLSLTIALASLIGAALGRFRRLAVLRLLRGALAFVGVAALAEWAVRLAHLEGRWAEWMDVLLLLAIGYLLARLALLFVFEWLLGQRVGVRVPRLGRDVVALLLYLLITATVLRAALGTDVGALLTGAGILTVVVGFALQETLGTLLAGLALAWEQRVASGTWVEVDGIVGQVEELGWRTLSLRTRLGENILVPNSQVARARLRVLGAGETPVAVPVRLGVAYGAPPHAVKGVLCGVAADVPEVVTDPPTQVLVREFADNAVNYEVRLWTREPWRAADVVDAFLTRAHAALARAGMEVPFPQRTVHVREAPAAVDGTAQCRAALARCELFAGLPEDGALALAAASQPLAFAPGESVVREGEASRALYVIAAGEATVMRGGNEIARIAPGEVFGEMAFLSGEPRAATVRAASALEVVEVDSHALGVLLASHAELAEELARRMAERQQHLASFEAEVTEEHSPRGLVGFLRDRLLAFVGL